MGADNSRQVPRASGSLPPPPGLGFPEGYVPGDQGGYVAVPDPSKSLAGTLPPGLRLKHGDLFAIRKIPPQELKEATWKQLPNAIPVYVGIPGLGVSITSRFRVVGGIVYYAVYKVYPLNPENNVVIQNYYEVPHVAGRKVLVYPLKYAILRFWAKQNTVVFVTNLGRTFKVKYSELLDIRDVHIKIAINMFRNDYPNQLDSVLAFRPVEAPQFEMEPQRGPNGAVLADSGRVGTIGTEDLPPADAGNFTSLSDTPRSQALYDALEKQDQCFLPPRAKPAPAAPPKPLPTVTVFEPDCAFDNGVPSLYDPERLKEQDGPACPFPLAASKIGRNMSSSSRNNNEIHSTHHPTLAHIGNDIQIHMKDSEEYLNAFLATCHKTMGNSIDANAENAFIREALNANQELINLYNNDQEIAPEDWSGTKDTHLKENPQFTAMVRASLSQQSISTRIISQSHPHFAPDDIESQLYHGVHSSQILDY